MSGKNMNLEGVNARGKSSGYNHAEWETRRKILRWLLRVIGVPLFARVDLIKGIDNVPTEGSAIIMINHISFVDPFIVANPLPRNLVAMAKIEVYDYPIVGIIPKIWGVIPVRRGKADRRAVQSALEVLKAGEILLVAPEGTRGPALRQGLEGVAYLASRSGAQIVPVAVDNTEGFPALRFTKRWRQPGGKICYGRPFRYHADLHRAKAQTLRKMTDEAMYVLAAMLPEHRRGFYADLSKATQDTFEYC
jgi:1-acyl-sn-glycerol-3-phosphate acyltransferase